MKNMITKLFLPMAAIIALVSCDGGIGSSKEIPDYALGQTSYFVANNGEEAIFCNNIVPQKVKTLGYDQYNRLLAIRGFDMELDGKKFCLVSKQYTAANALVTKDSYKLHALIKQAQKDNPYFKEGEFYSDSYYFVNPEELAKAIETFNNTPKTSNNASEFKVSDVEDGAKTYNSKVIAVVNYVGSKNQSENKFASLYLECGAVVALEGEDLERMVGSNIDCVVDKNNYILEREY